MGLEKYQEKRKFDATPEPAGKARKGQSLDSARKGPLRFVIQKHEASRLHYDFRLEMGGVLKSWAVPKGPSLNPKDRHLAMMTEDHPYEYKDFEGVIPKDNYGAGTVMIWDEGTYFPGYVDHDGQVQRTGKTRAEQDKEMRHQLHKQHLTFIMEGTKLKGEFALIKIKNSDDDNAWLLIKKGDSQADPEHDITRSDRSAASGRTMKQIESAADRQWSKGGEVDVPDLSLAPKAAMPHNVKPMLATLTDAPFDGAAWLFEVKWDGYRAIAEVDKQKIRLYSRNLQPFNAKFGPIVESLKSLSHRVVLDGEVVAVDNRGRSRFQLLQNYQTTGQGNLVYYVFDILWLDGHSLMKLPLAWRKQILKQVLPDRANLRLSDHVEGKGKQFFAAAKLETLEGMIAKQADSPYRPGIRTKSWLKVKTHLRQEAVVGGFTDPRGSREALGALLLGVYEGKKLVYIGHAGGGFNDKSLRAMKQLLEPLVRATSPFSNTFKTNAKATWVKPEVVVEVSFAEWTGDGHLRQPILVGIREDRDPKSVRREIRSPSAAPSPSTPSRQHQSGNESDKILAVKGRRLKVTHLDKVFWPGEGYTKGDVIDYYRQVSPVILPHLKDRPQSLNRHPNGISAPSFYQKDMPANQVPNWAKTAKIYSQSNEADINFLICNDEATLVYMANLGSIEINPWNSRLAKLEQPDWLVMDLDPEDIGFDQVIRTAQAVRQVLDEAGVASYPKTSGATGLHIYVPLEAKYHYDQAREFAHLVALLVNQRLPDITSVERSPAKRQGRVYLDYLQNRHGQTLAAAYSLRPKPGATVSTPLLWEEVSPGLDPKDFTIKTIFRRLDDVGDLWSPVLGEGTDLNLALERLSKSG